MKIHYFFTIHLMLTSFFGLGFSTYAESTNAVVALTMEEVEARLDQERENVRISRESERRLQERMRELMAEDDPDGALIREYAEYLEKLEAIREEHEKTLADMQAVYSNRSDAGSTATTEEEVDNSDLEYKLPEEDEQSTRLEELEKAFGDSVEEFDRFLHKEQEGVEYQVRQISDASAKRVGALKEEAADKRDALLNRGEKLPEAQKKKAEPPEEQAQDDKVGKKPQTTATKTAPPLKGPSPKTEPVPDRNPQTDDVVARQLREAAEKETDPELRRRLWAEYDDYKAGIE